MLLSEWVEFISVQMTLLHCYKVTCVIMVSNLNISKFNQASVSYRGVFFLITVVFPLCQDLQQPAILRQLSGVRSQGQSSRVGPGPSPQRAAGRGVECVARAGARQRHGHNRPRGAQRPQPPVQPPGAALAITLSCLPTLYTHSTDSLYYMITLYTNHVSYDHPVGASQPGPRQAALHR